MVNTLGLERADNMEEENTQVIENVETEEIRTFSQDDVNRIVGERLERERKKLEKEYSERESALNQRELAMNVKDYLSSKGLPYEWATAIPHTTLDEFKERLSAVERAQAKTIQSKAIQTYEPKGGGAPSTVDKIAQYMGLKKG